MEMKPYIVYVKLDDKNLITAVNSSAFLPDVTGWTEIDSGYGDKYHHAQGNYFDKPIMDERGIKRYEAVTLLRDLLEEDDPCIVVFEGADHYDYGIYERTQEEMDADYVPPVHQPSEDERITALEQALTAIEEGIASV